MTELMFPSGQLVRIDEGHVWSELANWSKDTKADRSRDVRMRYSGGRYEVELIETTGYTYSRHWLGRSELSLGDAAANALQKAISVSAA